MAPILHLGEADQLPSQRLANEHLLAAPLDGARWAHTSHLVIGIVPGLLEPLGQLPRWTAPMLHRGCLAQRLVWTLLVVVPTECVKSRLLLGTRCRRGARGLVLQRAV